MKATAMPPAEVRPTAEMAATAMAPGMPATAVTFASYGGGPCSCSQ